MKTSTIASSSPTPYNLPPVLGTEFQFDDLHPLKTYKNLIITAWVILIFNLGLTIIFYFQLPPEIPLFYTLSEPSQQLAPKIWFFLLPILGLTINLAHSFWIKWLKKYDEFLLRLWSGITVAWQILLLLIVVRIIFLVT